MLSLQLRSYNKNVIFFIQSHKICLKMRGKSKQNREKSHNDHKILYLNNSPKNTKLKTSLIKYSTLDGLSDNTI